MLWQCLSWCSSCRREGRRARPAAAEEWLGGREAQGEGTEWGCCGEPLSVETLWA